MDPVTLNVLIQNYAQLGRVMISLGLDAVKGIRALVHMFQHEMTVEEQDALLAKIFANAELREALARLDASGGAPPAA